MKLICKFCNTSYEETLTNCPNCGAPNENIKKTAESGPRTLEELKYWFYTVNKLTSAKTHIYIGEDCKESAVYGIYKDENTGDFVVYKNKDTGERAIRYQGVDEQYAVNELYQLIQRQAIRNGVALNGALNAGRITDRNSAINSNNNYKESDGFLGFVAAFMFMFFIFFMIIALSGNTTSSKSSRSTWDYDWSSSSSGSSGGSWSSGSSWDSGGGSWDSGDWSGDWGYNIDGYKFII